MENTTPSSVQCSGSLSDEAEDEDSDDPASPLNLSKRDRNKSDDELKSESEYNDEDAPLDLCLRAKSTNQFQTSATMCSEDLPDQVSVSQAQITPSEQEQCDRRHSAAFALCQLASSSNINTPEHPVEPRTETQSPGHGPAQDQAPNDETTEKNTTAKGQKRASNEAAKTSSKRVRLNETVRDKRRRTQNC